MMRMTPMTATNTVIMASLTDPDGPPKAALPVTDTKIVDAHVGVGQSPKFVQGDLDIDNPDHWGDCAWTRSLILAELYAGYATDVARYLRVTATYTDTVDGDGKDGAHAMSAYPVQAAGLGATNQSPDFDGDKFDRSVAETAEVGDDVPGPVVATVVARSDTDILTYGLRAFVEADRGATGVTLAGGRRCRRRPCRLRHRQGDGTDHGGPRAGLREQRHSERWDIRRGRHGHGPQRPGRHHRGGHHGPRHERSPGVEGTAGADHPARLTAAPRTPTTRYLRGRQYSPSHKRLQRG